MDVGTGIWDYQAICEYISERYLANRAWLKTFGKEPAGGRFRQESILAALPTNAWGGFMGVTVDPMYSNMIGNKDCLSNVAGTSAAVEITHWMTAMVE
jgi:hypothetical protein